MLHHPRPRTPISSQQNNNNNNNNPNVLDIARPPTRSERLLRDALLKDESIRTSCRSPSRQRSHTTPKVTSSPSRTATPTPLKRSSTSPVPHYSSYHGADCGFSGPHSPPRPSSRRPSKSDGQIPRRFGMDFFGGGLVGREEGVEAPHDTFARSSSPTPHEMVLRARLEGVLSAARQLEGGGSRAGSSSRPTSPSPPGSSTAWLKTRPERSSSGESMSSSSQNHHARRSSLQLPRTESRPVFTRKRSNTGSSSNPYTARRGHSNPNPTLSSSPSDTSAAAEDELALLTPPPTPPTYHRAFSPFAHRSPAASCPASSPARTTIGLPHRTPPPPRLLQSRTSPPGTLPTSPTRSGAKPAGFYTHPHPTPPESGSASPSYTDSPPVSPSLCPSFPSGGRPQFNARKASEHCRAMEGYVSFAAVEGLGSPPDGVDEVDPQEGGEEEGRRGWMGMFSRR